jgi:TPP-dependent pyruvate/acetoin dehydrogenase alpha subunit
MMAKRMSAMQWSIAPKPRSKNGASKKDPLLHAERLLMERGILTEEECRAMEAEVQAEVDEAVEVAENSPEPSLDSIFEDLYTGEAIR